MHRQFNQENPKFPSILEECTRVIISEVDRLQNMVHEFSEFARLPKVFRLPSNPRSVLDDTIAPFAVSHPHVHLVIRDHRSDLRAYFPLDADAIKQALWNLIKNAIEATTSENIRVDITITKPAKSTLAYVVRDYGSGLKQEDSEHVLTPYFTTKDYGSGLGLAISHRIAEEHQGHIRAEGPDDGKNGAVFILTLSEGDVETESPKEP